MTKYVYQVVAGAAIYGEVKPTLDKARAAVRDLRNGCAPWRDPNAEVERVQLLNNNSRRYWRWRRGRWSLKDHSRPSPQDLEKWS